MTDKTTGAGVMEAEGKAAAARVSLPLRDKVRFWLVEKSLDDGWEQATIADFLGISPKHMSLVWNGKSGMSWELADRWAEVIGVQFTVTADYVEED